MTDTRYSVLHRVGMQLRAIDACLVEIEQIAMNNNLEQLDFSLEIDEANQAPILFESIDYLRSKIGERFSAFFRNAEF